MDSNKSYAINEEAVISAADAEQYYAAEPSSSSPSSSSNGLRSTLAQVFCGLV